MSKIRVSRGAVTTRFPRDIDPNTNEGRSKAFWQGAGECFSAAKKLDDEDALRDTVGEYILIFHALELGLKAYLAKRGFSDKQLWNESFGHNLVNLVHECREVGMSLSIHDADLHIEWLSKSHKSLRYVFTETREQPMGRVLLPIVQEVLDASKPTLKNDKTLPRTVDR